MTLRACCISEHSRSHARMVIDEYDGLWYERMQTWMAASPILWYKLLQICSKSGAAGAIVSVVSARRLQHALQGA